ncbi:MAG: hypothetical protein GY756_21415 [bacterium]|nr:hypothetical protein [bacterium]
MELCEFCANNESECLCQKLDEDSTFFFFKLHFYYDFMPIEEIINFIRSIEEKTVNNPNKDIETELYTIKKESCHWCGHSKIDCVCEEVMENKDGLFYLLFDYVKNNQVPKKLSQSFS